MFTFHFLFLARLYKRKSAQFLVSGISLMIGFTASLLLGSYVWQALHVNSDLLDADRIYFLEAKYKGDEKIFPFLTPSPIAKELSEEYPTLCTNYYRFWDRMVVLAHGDDRFEEQTIIGDSTLFSMFGFNVLHGDGRRAIQSTNSIIITRKIATKYFGKEEVVGEVLTLTTEMSGNKPFVIGAVIDDLVDNSVTNFMNINAQIFLYLDNAKDFSLPDPTLWHRSSTIISFIKLSENTTSKEASNAVRRILEKKLPSSFLETLDRCELVPLKSLYLQSDNGAARKKIISLSIIGAFILLVTCVNFLNLTMLGAIQRVKEFGIRKTYGAGSKHITVLLFLDSLFLMILPTFGSVILYEFFRPILSAAIAFELKSVFSFDMLFWIYTIGVYFTLILVTSIYPTIMLNKLKISYALRGQDEVNRRTFMSRVILFIQFTLSMGMFAFALYSSEQNNFLTTSALGFDRDNIITVSAPRIWNSEGINKMQTAIDEFLRLPLVEAATLSWEVPDGNYGNSIELYKEGQSEDQAIALPMFISDEKYANTFGMKIIDGVFFQAPGEDWQPQKVVINESASRLLGLKVGDQVKVKNRPFVFVVSGIIQDFRYTSMHQTSGPIMFVSVRLTQSYRFISFKLNENMDSNAMHILQEKWRSVFPDYPFSFFVLQEKLASAYSSEFALEGIVKFSSFLFSFTSMFTIFSLMLTTLTRKKKEIAIRRVMGASNLKIIENLGSQYFLTLAYSFSVAAPLSMYFTHNWLQTFAYKVDLSLFPVFFSGLIFSSIVVTIIATMIIRISKQEISVNLRIN